MEPTFSPFEAVAVGLFFILVWIAAACAIVALAAIFHGAGEAVAEIRNRRMIARAIAAERQRQRLQIASRS